MANPRCSYVLEKTTKRKKEQKSRERSVVRKYKDLKSIKKSYADFQPLYEMWKKYMEEIANGSETKDERLLKADYHGCLLHVTRALNISQSGICGIVIRETKNTFLLITKNNRLLTVPKHGSVFQFVLERKIFTIYGDNFRSTSAGRIQKKFKNTVVPDLVE